MSRRVETKRVVANLRRYLGPSHLSESQSVVFPLIDAVVDEVNRALDEIDPPTIRSQPISYADGASTEIAASVTCPICGERVDVQRGLVLDHRRRVRGWGYDSQGRAIPADVLVECVGAGSRVEPPT